jgi:GAF domain-containing protein
MEKEKQYQLLVEQVRSLAEGEDDAISVMANMSAAIHEAMGFWWTGFYIERDGMLRLGPFQGPVACYRIPHGRGVCGTAYERRQTVIVPDVEQFPGHIACSSLSRSEIVVPVFAADGSVRAVLDIDSKDLGTFDETDRKYLEEIVRWIP